MTAHRVKIVVLDLEFPQGGFPVGLGGFLDQLVNGEREPEAPPRVTAGAAPAEQIERSLDAGELNTVETESAPRRRVPARRKTPVARAAPKKERAPSRATPGLRAQRSGKDDPRRPKAKALWEQRGLSVAEIGQELGLEPSTLYYWKSADDWGEKGDRTA